MANPSLNDPDLKKLLKVMKAAGYPMHINVRTEPGALLFECVDNVNKMVHIIGGDIVLGWQIWKTKHLIEAELHAVWQRPDRTLVDVSPKQLIYHGISLLTT